MRSEAMAFGTDDVDSRRIQELAEEWYVSPT